MKASADLLHSTTSTSDYTLDAGFKALAEARGYVPIVLSRGEMGLLRSFLDAVCQASDDMQAREADLDTATYASVAASVACKVASDILSVRPMTFVPRVKELTCADAMRLVTDGAPSVDIDLVEDHAVHVLRRDVAESLKGLSLMRSVDIEAAARRKCTHMDDHEGPPRRQVDIDHADELFRETYPTFNATLQSMRERVDGLHDAPHWAKPRI